MVDQASCSIKIVGNGNANMFVARGLVLQERQSIELVWQGQKGCCKESLKNHGMLAVDDYAMMVVVVLAWTRLVGLISLSSPNFSVLCTAARSR